MQIMTSKNLSENTFVDYSEKNTQITTHVKYLQKIDNNSWLCVADQTPFHARDFQWPDQPADRGCIFIADQKFDVTDCVMVAFHPETETLSLDTSISVKRNADGYLFHTAHIVRDDNGILKMLLNEKTEIILQVDQSYRNALNISHSLCHLMSISLNKACITYWTKEINELDSLGSPNFDQLCIQHSEIKPNGSIDIYRLGKSIRKKGLDIDKLTSNLDDIRQSVLTSIQDWLSQKLYISHKPNHCTVDTKKTWSCKIDGKQVNIPCGGTHPQSIDENIKIMLDLSIKDKMLTVTLNWHPA